MGVYRALVAFSAHKVSIARGGRFHLCYVTCARKVSSRLRPYSKCLSMARKMYSTRARLCRCSETSKTKVDTYIAFAKERERWSARYTVLGKMAFLVSTFHAIAQTTRGRRDRCCDCLPTLARLSQPCVMRVGHVLTMGRWDCNLYVQFFYISQLSHFASNASYFEYT